MQHLPEILFATHVSSKKVSTIIIDFLSILSFISIYTQRVIKTFFSFVVKAYTPIYGQDNGDIQRAITAPILITVCVITVVVLLFIGCQRLCIFCINYNFFFISRFY